MSVHGLPESVCQHALCAVCVCVSPSPSWRRRCLRPPQEAPEEEMEEDLADARARKAREEAERRRLEELKKSKVGCALPG
jgi:hypothetical protein